MKAQRDILILIFVSLSTCIQAQNYINSIYENILFGGIINSNASTIHEVNDTIYLFGAQTTPPQPDLGHVYGLGIYKISPSGELLDELAVVSDSMQIVTSGKGGVLFKNDKFYVPYYTAGPDSSDHSTGVMIYNRDLELVDEWLFGDPNYSTRILKIIDSAEGGYLICGFKLAVLTTLDAPYNYGYLAKLNEEGELIWERNVSGSIDFEYINENSNGDIFISGSQRYSGQTENIRDQLLVKVRPDGEEAWRFLFGGFGTQGPPPFQICSDGTIVVSGWEGDQSLGSYSGPMKIFRIEDLGEDFEIVQEKSFSGSIGQKNIFDSFIELQNGSFIAAGYKEYYFNNDWPVHGFAISLDEHLDSLWARHYYYFESLQSFHYIHDVKESSNGGLLMCGFARSSGQADPAYIGNAWLLQLDEYGCLEPGCQLVEGVENHVVGLQDVMQVIPNPTSGAARIEFDIPAGYETPARSFLTVYNHQGQEVLRKQVQSYELELYELDMSTLSSGVYLIQWHTDNEWLDNVKVVLE